MLNIHPLALAYLRAVSDFHTRAGTIERWESVSEAWKTAGCPIEDDGTYEPRDNDTGRHGPSADAQGISPLLVFGDPDFSSPNDNGDGDSNPN